MYGFRAATRGVALIATTSALSLTLGPPSRAGWIETPLTFTPTASTTPIITTDAFDVRHVFWQEGDDILHRAEIESGWGAVDVIGVGHDVDHYTCLR